MKRCFLFLSVFVCCCFFLSRVDAGNCCASQSYAPGFRETPLYRPSCCNYVDSCSYGCDRQCSIEIGAEFLYRKVCLDEFNWAFARTETTEANVTSIDLSYERLCLDDEPGVRAWLGFQPAGKESLGIYFGYVYLSGSKNDSIQQSFGNTIGTTVMHYGLFQESAGFTDIAVDWRNQYHEGEVVLGSSAFCGKNHVFLPYFGAAGIYLEQKFALDLSDPDLVFAGDAGAVDWESQYWGVGLRFGSHYKYQLGSCLAFIGRFNASLLVGENKFHNFQSVIFSSEAEELRLNISGKNKCHVVPGYSLGAGFAIEPEICGCTLSLRVGYEFNEWYNIPKHRTFSGESTVDGEVAYSDSASNRTWGSHGLFAGLSFAF